MQTRKILQVLVIEDDENVAKTLLAALELEHYHVTLAVNGVDGYFLATSRSFDLIITDLILPGKSGLQIIKDLRDLNDMIPILIITGKTNIEDRVKGLDIGADDYLVKPFAFPELFARIRALMRRTKTNQLSQLNIADLHIVRNLRKVRRGKNEIILSEREFDLLEYFMQNSGQIISMKDVLRDVWKIIKKSDAHIAEVDTIVKSLQEKIDSNYKSKLIKVIQGLGFILKKDVY